MGKLNEDKIQFIENYLKNSGVEHLDVRLEMTDHIVREIQASMDRGNGRGFYEIFKNYMLEHKTTLLKSRKKFRKQADRKAFKLLFSNSYRPKTLFFATLLIGAFFWANDFIVSHSAAFLFVVYIFLLVIYFLPNLFLNNNKFSTLQRLLLWFFLGSYLLFNLLFQNLALNGTIGSICFVFMIWLFVSVIKTLFDQVVYYRKNFPYKRITTNNS